MTASEVNYLADMGDELPKHRGGGRVLREREGGRVKKPYARK